MVPPAFKPLHERGHGGQYQKQPDGTGRFAGLQRKHGGSLWSSLWWTFSSLLLALGAFLLLRK